MFMLRLLHSYSFYYSFSSFTIYISLPLSHRRRFALPDGFRREGAERLPWVWLHCIHSCIPQGPVNFQQSTEIGQSLSTIPLPCSTLFLFSGRVRRLKEPTYVVPRTPAIRLLFSHRSINFRVWQKQRGFFARKVVEGHEKRYGIRVYTDRIPMHTHV